MSDITFSPTTGTTINDGTAVWTVRQMFPTSGRDDWHYNQVKC